MPHQTVYFPFIVPFFNRLSLVVLVLTLTKRYLQLRQTFLVDK